MVTLAELKAQVATRYDRLGRLSWPNPHPDGASAREEEYSRLTEPGRYGIVHARARVWTAVLGEIPGVEVATLPPAPLDDDGHLGMFDRGVRLTSPRPGTTPLLLLERDVPVPGHETSLAVLHISVGRPQVCVDAHPDCGCDACDWGSESLLEAMDQTIGNVVAGPFVAVRGEGWHAEWHPGGGSSGGKGLGPDHKRTMELCRRLARGEDVQLPDGAEAFVGLGWFD
jgi:Family of unknown function (DUF6226)